MAAISFRQISGWCSDITLRPSQDPGPLVGPVLAAQFGYLPGTLWILVGAVFGGCVQDFVILLFSVRRDGKSLTEMAKAEIGRIGGVVAYASVISILVILLAVCALIVVNALKQSPWGTFTIAMTIPIAFLMGVYLRRLRPGRVLETSAIGFVLVLAAIWGGQWVSQIAGDCKVFHSDRAGAGDCAHRFMDLLLRHCQCGCCWRLAII